MLAFLGLTMVLSFIYLIMSKRMSPINALILIPILFGIIAGFGAKLGEMMLEGIRVVAPTAALLLFAILFFGVMIDAGLFDPLIKRILKIVKGDPVKIAIGTAILALLVALDGDGTTTYMITISAMLPLYQRLNMNPFILATVALLSLSVMSSMTPWGGPATRAIASLGLDAGKFFIPLLPTMLGGIAWVILTAFFLGKKERQRIGIADIKYPSKETLAVAELTITYEQQGEIKRPNLIWINLLLTITIMITLVMGILPVPILFLIGFVLSSMINYPSLEKQKERMLAHSGNALTVVTLVFAAGIFTGIFSGTKMVDALAHSLISIIPDSLGSFFPLVVALTSMPFTFALSNDAYYFGVLPILAEAAAAYGVDPLEIARASILGQPVHLLSPLVASTLLLVGMVKIDIGEFQRYAFKWAILCSLAITGVALLTGAITLF
ncbi:CitMHS family transporter [Bacillus taeanensis]|uniref:Damage-inducible protein CinA n=1 Tax=Bacillus taeanensis TaxID=273032 RepID=A0A366XRV3_9BACI|nr:citrate:proton symporter [Bacillus taeanensis]RBW68627.1 damage-inducible protein CinA [Bacillus taeanensis]